MDLRFSEAELDRVREGIVSFVDEQVAAAGADGAVIGLSGGIDSSLVAHLAVEALGPGRVRGLVMPGTVSDPDNTSDGEAIAEKLGIEYDVVPIESVVDALVTGLPEVADDRVAVGNARARVRGVFNYLVANHEDRLVLGTGNRSEALAGYYTKYGDQAVDCNPIGDLYKTQVRQLARAVGLPERIVAKPPTAGLWEGQTDEDELGVSYETLDTVLALHVDGSLSAAATVRELGVDPEVVDRVRDLYVANEHKRRMPPAPGLDIVEG
ncbi:NAD(+) synthetase [Halobacteriales archaeon SW_7_68_16]|nr:MAG: NAD(+) synthetase [Halobacteriales archaeon SW_7_68_16]